MGGFYMQYLESKSSIDLMAGLRVPPQHRCQPQSHIIPGVVVGVSWEVEGIASPRGCPSPSTKLNLHRP